VESQISQSPPTEAPPVVETPTPAPVENVYAQPGTVLVIPRVFFNYVVIAIVFLTIGVVIGGASVNALFNANSAENRALVTDVVNTVLDERGAQVAANQPQGLDPNQRYDVSIEGAPAWGPDDAPVTIVEFSDFQCPYCERFFLETYPLLKANFGDKIRFVYRDFPLFQIHPNATEAAYAANCAFEQDKYWEYHDVLFNNQDKLATADLIVHAEDLGMDTEAFQECLQSGRYSEKVSRDYTDGVNLGVSGTPTFFINGKPLVGAQPYQIFADRINAELAALSDTAAS
jgi:protein-disulfide isomerase